MIDEFYLKLKGWDFYFYDDIEMDESEYYAINPLLKKAIGIEGAFEYNSDRYPHPSSFKCKVKFVDLPELIKNQLITEHVDKT